MKISTALLISAMLIAFTVNGESALGNSIMVTAMIFGGVYLAINGL